MVQQVNVTLDDVSPLITYSPPGAWSQGDNSDSSLSRYYGGTYTQTREQGASASFSFNGTTVWIIGAKRSKHGQFVVTIDDRTFTDSGYSNTDLFQQTLLLGSVLPVDNHNVTVSDAWTAPEQAYLDIDVVVYQVVIPDGHEKIPIDDTDKAFRFPSPAWTRNNTEHVTTSANASMVYTFEGDDAQIGFPDDRAGSHVEIYGSVGPAQGIYTVQVDNGNPVTFNGTRTNLVPQTLLYQNNSFAPGKHTVKISNSPFTGQTLRIDYAIIYGPPSSRPSTSLSAGVIGGIAVGSCACVLLLLFGTFFWWRRRRRKTSTPAETPPPTVDHGTGPIVSHTPSLPALFERQEASAVPVSTNLQLPPSAVSTQSPPQSNSSASNTDSRSRLILHNPSPSFGGPGGGGTQGQGLSQDAPDNAPPHQNSGQVTRPLPQPGQSNAPARENALVLAPLLQGDLRTVRMQVEGRSQDFGPVAFLPDIEHDGNLLPPDYHQATEPFPSRRQ